MLEELAHRVRSEAIDPIDLVEESIRRIEAAPGLNAVTEVFADEARERASRHDRQGPLAGLPLLVKDLARVEGHRTTFGSLLYAQAPPDTHDDVAVARLRAAGAIVLGRTNSPEFGAVGFTSNRLYGPTRNPWNPSTSPGGSSGGSAAALAAGLAPLATSSDGGGSTRGPASFCGLVGHKPTMGTIGRNFLPRWIEFSTQGSTAATVADVVLQLRVMRGGAPGDFLALPGGSADVEPRLPRTIYAVRTYRADVDARVEAITPGTGSSFSLLPAENATGNWVKVTQRVPVRVVFDKYPEVPLEPGLSASVTIDTTHKRHLFGQGSDK